MRNAKWIVPFIIFQKNCTLQLQTTTYFFSSFLFFMSPFKLWEIWWQTLYIISRSFIRRQIELAAEVRSGQWWWHRPQSAQCQPGARVWVILKLDSMIPEHSGYFPSLMISFLCCWSGLRSSFQVSPVVWFIDRVTQGIIRVETQDCTEPRKSH